MYTFFTYKKINLFKRKLSQKKKKMECNQTMRPLVTLESNISNFYIYKSMLNMILFLHNLLMD